MTTVAHESGEPDERGGAGPEQLREPPHAQAVAAPTSRADLGASLSALQWIAGGYALTFAVGLVTGGRLGDIFGRRSTSPAPRSSASPPACSSTR